MWMNYCHACSRMTDRVEKALRKLSDHERTDLERILQKIRVGDFAHLDIKKFKHRDDIYRVRKGVLRIIFQKRDGHFFILTVERRCDKTYS